MPESDFQSVRVDQLVTSQQNHKGRRTVNAGDAVNPQDYVTLSQVQDLVSANSPKAVSQSVAVPGSPAGVNPTTIVICTNVLVLTTTLADILGCSINVPANGTYSIRAFVGLVVDGATPDRNIDVIVDYNGTALSPGIPRIDNPSGATSQLSISFEYIRALVSPLVVKLRAKKGSGAGGSQISLTTTLILHKVA